MTLNTSRSLARKAMICLPATAVFTLIVLANFRTARAFHFGWSVSSMRSGAHRRLHLLASAPIDNDGDSAISSVPTKRRRRPRRRKSQNNNKRQSNGEQTWRLFGIEVHPDELGRNAVSPMEHGDQQQRLATTIPGRARTSIPPEKAYLTGPVLAALMSKLRLKRGDIINPLSSLPSELKDVRVIRRSLDARKRRSGAGSSGPRYIYVIDIDVSSSTVNRLRLKHQPGKMELLSPSPRLLTNQSQSQSTARNEKDEVKEEDGRAKPTVVIVGAGPAGLFCALTLARSGKFRPVVLERGQAVESRGKDIGALVNRRLMNTESNFAFGEGGAGTWSDGKLTTRIGRNQGPVRAVLETLVKYGAPEKVLIDGSPHLGTDNLVKLLKNMRADLRNLGGEIRFGARMTELGLGDGAVKNVKVEYSEAIERGVGGVVVGQGFEGFETISADAVVLATGHSARDVYVNLHEAGIKLEPKGFATGFRVEHPQCVINKIQYGQEWGRSVVTGRSVTDSANEDFFDALDDNIVNGHEGCLPVASYRLATDKAFDGEKARGAYSFCMCPGGQVVPASTNPDEVCVNGMSFSRRQSLWANSALVVTISPDDPVLEKYREKYGVLAGIEFQKDMEKAASKMGGGNLTAPVQRLPDFVAGRASTSAPSSSYRLGVKPAACHEIYPELVTNALRDALVNHFEKQMPGYLCEDGLLHGVETRTSSPVRVSRDSESCQAIGCKRLFPAGEGAGFAGGIVSAAVDGIAVADAVLDEFGENTGSDGFGGRDREQQKKQKKKSSVGFDY